MSKFSMLVFHRIIICKEKLHIWELIDSPLYYYRNKDAWGKLCKKIKDTVDKYKL